MVKFLTVKSSEKISKVFNNARAFTVSAAKTQRTLIVKSVFKIVLQLVGSCFQTSGLKDWCTDFSTRSTVTIQFLKILMKTLCTVIHAKTVNIVDF